MLVLVAGKHHAPEEDIVVGLNVGHDPAPRLAPVEAVGGSDVVGGDIVFQPFCHIAAFPIIRPPLSPTPPSRCRASRS